MTEETKPKQLDFAKVDALRKNLILTKDQMAQLLGVSRQTYYSWVDKVTYPKDVRLMKVRQRMKQLFTVLNEHGWPTAEVLEASQKERYDKLLSLLADS